jgi:hypothetical protein
MLQVLLAYTKLDGTSKIKTILDFCKCKLVVNCVNELASS